MSFTARVDPTCRVNYLRMSGVVTFADLSAAQRALADDDAFDPTFGVLVDLRAAEEVRLTWQEMQILVVASAVAPTSRRAILVGSPGVLGMARLYQSMREHETAVDVVRACQTMDEAIAWLGIDALELQERDGA